MLKNSQGSYVPGTYAHTKMKTPLGWPSIYQARELVPANIQTVRQLEHHFKVLQDHYESTPKLWYLVMCEMILRYQLFADSVVFQELIDVIIEKGCDHLTEEYRQQFKVLSDSHILRAKQAYIEFIFTNTLCRDVARHISSFL